MKQVEVVTVVNADGEVSYVYADDLDEINCVNQLTEVDREIYHTP